MSEPVINILDFYDVFSQYKNYVYVYSPFVERIAVAECTSNGNIAVEMSNQWHSQDDGHPRVDGFRAGQICPIHPCQEGGLLRGIVLFAHARGGLFLESGMVSPGQ